MLVAFPRLRSADPGRRGILPCRGTMPRAPGEFPFRSDGNACHLRPPSAPSEWHARCIRSGRGAVEAAAGVGGLLDGGVCFPVAQQLAVEGLAVEPEHLGGERPVPTDGPENVEDIAPFDLFHGNQFSGIVASQHHL